MRQICLIGPQACALALRLFEALGQRPVGYRLVPFALAGREKGQLLRLLASPPGETANDVPCVARLGPEREVVIHEALDEVAAPALRRTLHVHAPVLLDGLRAAFLAPGAFRDAVADCLAGPYRVVACLHPDAEPILRGMEGGKEALFLPVTGENMEDLMLQLQGECFLDAQ